MDRRQLLGGLTGALVLIPAAPAAAAPAKATGAGAPAPARTDRGRTLQRLLDDEHAAGMPGAFAQVRDGHRVWRPAAGVADVQTGRPVRPWFRHRVGSITKTFVATVILQLVDEHRVSLDAPIGRYLPDVVPGDVGRRVTVRMLLNHTSGIGNYTAALLQSYEDLEWLRTATFTPQQLVAIGLGMPPTGAPGVQHSYSNTGYIVLGLLIERLTGRRYAEELRRRILRPLDLHDTYAPGADPYIRGPHARAYLPWPTGELRDFSVYNMTWAWAAGELISTMSDLNRFYRSLLSGRLLRRSLLAEMQRTVPFDPAAPDAGGYGLGLYWVPAPCGRVWGHDGGVIGQTTVSVHSPDAEDQVSLAENMNFYQTPGEPHPIDEARGRFLEAAVCGTEVTAATRGRVPATGLTGWLPLTPDVSLSRARR